MIDLLFVFLCALCVFFGISVVAQKNPVYSVLSLVVVFLCVSCIFFLLKIDFLAIALITLYLGAIVVLFLFVVMMISDDAGDTTGHCTSYKIAGTTTIVTLLGILGAFIYYGAAGSISKASSKMVMKITPSSWIQNLGMTIFSDYGVEIVLVGAILLISVLGAVTLTAEGIRADKKKQVASDQLNRGTSVKINRVGFRTGVDWK